MRATIHDSHLFAKQTTTKIKHKSNINLTVIFFHNPQSIPGCLTYHNTFMPITDHHIANKVYIYIRDSTNYQIRGGRNIIKKKW